MTKREAYENLKDYLDNTFHYSNDHETYCYLRDCADTLAPPDADTGPEGSIRKREKMRSVKKETMDELARLVRKYWATGDKDILDAKHRKASELSEQAYGSAAKWIQFCDLLNGTVCFNRNVSNEIIYKIFGLLCIEVSAPVEEGAEE